MNKKIIELLYRSFDHQLTAEEEKLLREELETSAALRNEKEITAALRQQISDSTVNSFKPLFAERVMRRIAGFEKKETNGERFFESLFIIFRPVVIAATLIIIFLISYNLMKSDQISLANAFPEPDITLEQVLEPTLPLTME